MNYSSGTSVGSAKNGSIVYVTLEYCLDDLFSGNGVCARSHVRGIAKQGWHMHIICGRPKDAPLARSADTPRRASLYECPLNVWRTTDRYADHENFARSAARALENLVAGDAAFLASVQAVMLVDWTGAAAVEVMDEALRSKLLAKAPVFFLNFRVYTRMTNITEEDRAWYRKVEVRSMRRAIDSGGGVMSLSKEDNEELMSMCEGSTPPNGFEVILPMLREEFSAIARRDRDMILNTSRKRRYLVCLVRLAKDKGAHRFVNVCEAMTERDPGIWERVGVVPLMAGAASQPDFAVALRRRFKTCVPCGVVVDQFLNSAQLGQILLDSVLNIHPSLYEAYGMTIVEAGSCGVPSLMHVEGIGAAQLLRPDAGESFAVDMDDARAAGALTAALLADETRTAEAGRLAYAAATSWTEDEHVAALLEFVSARKAASVR